MNEQVGASLAPIFNFASLFYFGGCYAHVIWEKQVKSDARFISITINKGRADVVFYFSFGLLLLKNELKSKKCEGKKKRKSNHVNNNSI